MSLANIALFCLKLLLYCKIFLSSLPLGICSKFKKILNQGYLFFKTDSSNSKYRGEGKLQVQAIQVKNERVVVLPFLCPLLCIMGKCKQTSNWLMPKNHLSIFGGQNTHIPKYIVVQFFRKKIWCLRCYAMSRFNPL